MPEFHVTYEIVTPESAEHGDAAERGYVMPGGWQYELPNDCCGDVATKFAAEHALTLREAIGLMSCVEDSGHWFVETDGRVDYQDGNETRYSFHPPRNCSPASYHRIARLLGVAR